MAVSAGGAQMASEWNALVDGIKARQQAISTIRGHTVDNPAPSMASPGAIITPGSHIPTMTDAINEMLPFFIDPVTGGAVDPSKIGPFGYDPLGMGYPADVYNAFEAAINSMQWVSVDVAADLDVDIQSETQEYEDPNDEMSFSELWDAMKGTGYSAGDNLIRPSVGWSGDEYVSPRFSKRSKCSGTLSGFPTCYDARAWVSYYFAKGSLTINSGTCNVDSLPAGGYQIIDVGACSGSVDVEGEIADDLPNEYSGGTGYIRCEVMFLQVCLPISGA